MKLYYNVVLYHFFIKKYFKLSMLLSNIEFTSDIHLNRIFKLLRFE